MNGTDEDAPSKALIDLVAEIILDHGFALGYNGPDGSFVETAERSDAAVAITERVWAAALVWERARTADAAKAIMHVRRIMALGATDWGANYNHAIMWAILFGWDGDPDVTDDAGAWDLLAARYHWDADLVTRLRHERAAIAALVGIDAGRG